MAPSVAQLQQEAVADPIQAAKQAVKTEETKTEGPSYPYYFPYFDVDEKFPPLELFDHVDPGSRADPAKPHLLTPNVQTNQISPYLGTEISGVQISQLSKEGLDELALLVAERKVVVFRDQDFKDLGPEKQIEITKHFGPIHRHPTSGNVKGYPEFHVVYRDAAHDRFREYSGANRVSRLQWHSDVSYEKQPPGTTFFFILDQATPSSSHKLRLTTAFPRVQETPEGLRAVHSAVFQAEFSQKRGGPVRREPVETEHPLVRVHPVTGEKALYINQGFTRSIVGYKRKNPTFSQLLIRARYEPGTVVVWDNRVTAHSANADYPSTFRRHAVRLTPQAEVPKEAKFEAYDKNFAHAE
ncbi:hypothetical protein CPB84DRAFT_1926819 [Gymnopilus junonius]|uniref:TauD/TfdA-like domain-containing protein n=1 Tax=Gymnopilus junonius TaxID=109634 RepID=A0A9P5TLB6_GYMJU|nr:hypothetical protein CPB84DRAFT_1926819 [Gymnopilus junonius]